MIHSLISRCIFVLTLLLATVITQTILEDYETLDESRFRPEYFTRSRKMPFCKLLRFLLSMYKTSTQAALNKFLRKDDITMSQQALSKARNKFDHTPFWKLFIGIRDAFYSKEYLTALSKMYDKFIIAIDGSDTELPNMPSLCEKYGGTGSKSSSPTARMSIAYDVLNDFIMSADFTEMSTGERELALIHIDEISRYMDLKSCLFIMDRGYASEELIKVLSKQSCYLFRLRRKFNKDIDSLPVGSHTVTLYGDIVARVVKFALPSGEIETLLTNMFDIDEADFKALYFKRWPVEVKFDIVKNKLELPCFAGCTENVILQDFWITMYLANMVAIARNEANTEIKESRQNKENKYEYQANVNTIIGSLREEFAEAVFSSPIKRTLKINRIMNEIKRSVVPVRPDDGKTPRNTNSRKVKYHHNKISNL